MSARFIVLWNDKHDAERNACRVADGVAEAIRGIHDFLDDEPVYDEERPEPEFYEDSLKPGFQAFVDEVAGDDLAAFLTGMKRSESAELRCEHGRFEMVRDR